MGFSCPRILRANCLIEGRGGYRHTIIEVIYMCMYVLKFTPFSVLCGYLDGVGPADRWWC